MPVISRLAAAVAGAYGWGRALGEFVAVDFLVVAGGGGAIPQNNIGAGAGAGGVRASVAPTGGGASAESTLQLLPATTYTITIGAGGTYTYTGAETGNGFDSIFATVTSIGGGRGGARARPQA